jgi:protein TonB
VARGEKSAAEAVSARTLAGMTGKQLLCAIATAAVLSAVLNVTCFAQNAASGGQSNPAATGTQPPGAQQVYRVGRGVTAPKLLKHVEPEFSAQARKDKVDGLVILSMVVGADGLPYDIQVLRGAGHGLDEKAIEAVSQWRFEPGTKDGEPVPVEIRVEVNFHRF